MTRTYLHPVRGRTQAGGGAWADLGDEALLDLRLADLDLELRATALARDVAALHAELEARGLRFRPHAWLSSDWFSPDGVPGIALPFFLAHPRLKRMEKRAMGRVEGGGARERAQLLRHEAGHAIDTAYRLHRRARWKELFGSRSAHYAPFYKPEPLSRWYVQHLPHWYAQSHPAEDFAETFAVWLAPGARWRQRYRSWPALSKLEYVDELMREIGRRPPAVTTRERTDELAALDTTLREHWREKRARYAKSFPYAFDRELRRLFAKRQPGDRRPAAAAFLRRLAPDLKARVARFSREHGYTIEQVLGDMITRSRELELVVDSRPGEARLDAAILLAVQTMNYLRVGYRRLVR